MKLSLTVSGLGHVPSFKNNKMLLRKQGLLITDPKKQKWMDRCTRLFESQLRSGALIIGDVIWTEPCPRFLIAWCGQFDDSRQWIPEISVRWKTVPKGEEGATIILESI